MRVYTNKYEPIKCLSTLKVIGYEILTRFATEVDVESFFMNISADHAIKICQEQIRQLEERYSESAHFFINLPLRSFLSDELVNILNLQCSHKVSLELQDTYNLRSLTLAEASILNANITGLQDLGYSVWLDDVKCEFLDIPFLQLLKIDGIKIDKSELIKDTQHLVDLVRNCKSYTEHIIIEGIETALDLQKSVLSGADMGQGYLWEA